MPVTVVAATLAIALTVGAHLHLSHDNRVSLRFLLDPSGQRLPLSTHRLLVKSRNRRPAVTTTAAVEFPAVDGWLEVGRKRLGGSVYVVQARISSVRVRSSWTRRIAAMAAIRWSGVTLVGFGVDGVVVPRYAI